MDQIVLAELVTKASNGCQESKNALTEQFQDDLYRYVYRITLDQNLTEDVLQETLLQMLKSLERLCDVNNIRAWVFKVAWGKAMNHYRSTKKHRHMSIHENNLVSALESRRIEGLKTLISKEIAETLTQSISQMDVRQRNVLVLRCYENLSYTEISSIMNCSETAARVLFFRAKNQLKTKLRKKGVISKSLFLGLLGLFGQVTSRTQAAVHVSATSLKVGGLGTAIGWGLMKTGAFILSLIATTAIISGTVLTKTEPFSGWTGDDSDSTIKSFHFIKQAWKDAYIPNANLLMGKSLSKGAYEQWYFFPEGVNGPLFKMMQRWDPQVKNKLCSWLLNEDGQHYYNSGNNTIYLINAPLPKRNTIRLPSDSQEFCDFIDKMEGKEEGLEYVRDPKTGLLMELIDQRFANAKDFKSVIEHNILDEKTFGDYRYKWPENANFVDERDAIHKQGWTLFEITGQLNNTKIRGNCRIPFVYGQRDKHPPLLNLQIGNQYSVIDSPDGAFVLDNKDKVIASYPSGSFFKGLSRPWFGLHSINSIRRDATEFRVPFEIENLDFGGFYYKKRIVTLHSAPRYNNLKVSITIDINENQIENIQFTNDDAVLGSLEFVYPADPAEITETINMPDVKKGWFMAKEPIGILWLFELAEGTLGQNN